MNDYRGRVKKRWWYNDGDADDDVKEMLFCGLCFLCGKIVLYNDGRWRLLFPHLSFVSFSVIYGRFFKPCKRRTFKLLGVLSFLCVCVSPLYRLRLVVLFKGRGNRKGRVCREWADYNLLLLFCCRCDSRRYYRCFNSLAY